MKKIILLLTFVFATTSTVSAVENTPTQLQENWNDFLIYDERSSGN